MNKHKCRQIHKHNVTTTCDSASLQSPGPILRFKISVMEHTISLVKQKASKSMNKFTSPSLKNAFPSNHIKCAYILGTRHVYLRTLSVMPFLSGPP